MAIIDRIKFDGLRSREWLVYKHPTEKIVRGAQLVVGEGQAAVFVKSGKVYDMFNAGTYTLDAENLPLIQGILNIPFGGDTPLTAEIFYFNTTAKLDINWGTSDPIQLVDPKYFMRLRIRAFGQLGLKVTDYATFLRELIGVMPAADMVRMDNIIDYFKGLIVQKMKSIIADIIINQKISALEITPKINDIAQTARNEITPAIGEYGLSLLNFYIKSINFPDEDFDAINEILSKRAEFEIMGDSRYVTKRSFDVYEGAANNQSGVAGAFMAGGVGMGAGMAFGANAAQTLAPATSPASTIVCPSCNASCAAGTKFCPQCGASVVEPKAVCPKCQAENESGAKFCAQCGQKLAVSLKCEGCGEELSPGSKFCPSCGKAVEQ